MLRLLWTRQSRADLEEIRAYIAQDSSRIAELYIRKLMNSTKRLRQFPFQGQVVPELGCEDVREILFGNYRIIYRIRNKLVEVITVYHAARILHDDILS